MNMKIKQQFIIAILSLTMLSSCQKVIDIELNDADRQIVIEGSIYEGGDSAMVKITKTTSFFTVDPPEPVANAIVQLTMPDNNVFILNHEGQGLYKISGLNIINDADYKLKVTIGNDEYTAVSHMMPSIALDSLEYEFQEPIFGQPEGYNVFMIYQDQIGKNYYRLLSSVNGTPQRDAEDLLVVDDNLNDGNLIRIPIFTRLFEPGDTVEAELQSLDAELYEFYQTLGSVASEDAGSPFSAAPANPEGNISGGALGVWGAYTSSKRTIILPE
jgi:hypothetical protein